MHKLMILIDQLDDPGTFEARWPQFLHWAEQMPGLQTEATSRVTRQVFGVRPLAMVHELFFDSPQSAYRAMESPAGQQAGQTLQAITGGRVTLVLADHRQDDIANIRRARQAEEHPNDATAE